MSKEEYIKSYNALTKQIDCLKRLRRELNKKYVDTNQPYPIGTKVKLTYKTCQGKIIDFGIIKGYTICYEDVKPILSKVNKNGTPHKTATLFIEWWKNPTIEIA